MPSFRVNFQTKGYGNTKFVVQVGVYLKLKERFLVDDVIIMTSQAYFGKITPFLQ